MNGFCVLCHLLTSLGNCESERNMRACPCRSRCLVTRRRRGADVGSLRFRFKTFELDCETPRVFCRAPGHLKLSRRTTSATDGRSHYPESLSLQLPSRNYFRSLVSPEWPKYCRVEKTTASRFGNMFDD